MIKTKVVKCVWSGETSGIPNGNVTEAKEIKGEKWNEKDEEK